MTSRRATPAEHRAVLRERGNKRDVAGLPEALRVRLLAHARRSGDSDKQGRAER
ncbi:hypothetical protein [Streptomyces erythrochromogenes]|uniref:hypothetical protein n=1 Tax=Streptomyces erythrochromogenes TaxID=285574 RepID=UPI00131AA269|nr:hypothetical protein [Streptomyces erythrochromogenes]